MLYAIMAVTSIIVRQCRLNEDGNKASGISVGKLISQIVLFLTQLCGLAVAVLNVLKASSL